MMKKIFVLSGLIAFSAIAAQKTHTVAKGDNPYNISKKYGMTTDELLKLNPKVKDVFVKRTKLFTAMRNFFNDKGYFEVETPILQSIPGGAAARPFVTHHNALDIPLYLRIANELYLKRLIRSWVLLLY